MSYLCESGFPRGPETTEHIICHKGDLLDQLMQCNGSWLVWQWPFAHWRGQEPSSGSVCEAGCLRGPVWYLLKALRTPGEGRSPVHIARLKELGADGSSGLSLHPLLYQSRHTHRHGMDWAGKAALFPSDFSAAPLWLDSAAHSGAEPSLLSKYF